MGLTLSKVSSAWGKSAQAKRLARLLVFFIFVAIYVPFFPLLHQIFGWSSVFFPGASLALLFGSGGSEVGCWLLFLDIF